MLKCVLIFRLGRYTHEGLQWLLYTHIHAADCRHLESSEWARYAYATDTTAFADRRTSLSLRDLRQIQYRPFSEICYNTLELLSVGIAEEGKELFNGQSKNNKINVGFDIGFPINYCSLMFVFSNKINYNYYYYYYCRQKRNINESVTEWLLDRLFFMSFFFISF